MVIRVTLKSIPVEDRLNLVTFRAHRTLIERVEKIATKLQKSKSDLIRQSIEFYLDVLELVSSSYP